MKGSPSNVMYASNLLAYITLLVVTVTLCKIKSMIVNIFYLQSVSEMPEPDR